MEKINQVMDMIEHPDKYSEAQVKDILQDEECRQTYLTMMEIRMAFDKKNAKDSLDLDQEWQAIKIKHHIYEEQSADEKVDADKPSLFSWRKLAASIVGVLLLSGVAIAAIHTFYSRREIPKQVMADTAVIKQPTPADTLPNQYSKSGGEEKQKEHFHKTFDNVALGAMLEVMAKYYGVEVEYHNQEAKQLRFYYEWNSVDELQKVLDELNHSQQVSLSLENGAIVVE